MFPIRIATLLSVLIYTISSTVMAQTRPAVATSQPLPAESKPAEQDGLVVTVQPTKEAFWLNEPFVMTITYRNVSKEAFRIPDQVVFRRPDQTEVTERALFWQLKLQSVETGKSYTSIDREVEPGWFIRPSEPIPAGGTLVTTVTFPRFYFNSDGPDPREGGLAGPGDGYSGLIPLPTGAYRLSVNIRFLGKRITDADPTPLWKGDAILCNPVEIEIAPENGAERQR